MMKSSSSNNSSDDKPTNVQLHRGRFGGHRYHSDGDYGDYEDEGADGLFVVNVSYEDGDDNNNPSFVDQVRHNRSVRIGLLVVAIMNLLITATIFCSDVSLYTTTTAKKYDVCSEERLYLSETRLQAWKHGGQPILSTATKNPDTQETYLMFRYPLIKYFDMDNEIDLPHDFKHAEWFCDGEAATEPYPTRYAVKVGRIINIFLVKCPALPLTHNGLPVTVTVRTPDGEEFVYDDLDDFLHCQAYGHPMSQLLEAPYDTTVSSMNAVEEAEKALTPATSNTIMQAPLLHHVVMCTMIRGTNPQAYLPQWIEYHRRVFGIPHFFVYINEPWDAFKKRKSYQEWDYVTYVPFSLGYYHDDGFYYQRMQQNDAFWRVKQLALSPTSKDRYGANIEWVGMMDIDEYLDAPTVDAAVLGQDPRPESAHRDHLAGLLDEHADTPIGAVLFRNTYFGGRHANQFEWVDENELPLDILLCRFTRHAKPKKGRRQKFFAQVSSALYMNVHLVHFPNDPDDINKGYNDSKGSYWMDPRTELRHNHFKLNYARENEEVTIPDSTFGQAFCPMMKDLLE